jgi:hypothetical protein
MCSVGIMKSRILEQDSSTGFTKENVLYTVILIYPRRECIIIMLSLRVRWDSSVGIATGCRLEGRSSVSNKRKRFFSRPQRPDQLWGPPSLLFNGYRRLFPVGKVVGE